MGLDVCNNLFGNFHVNWAGTRWFRIWCLDHSLPEPFIGWESGLNDGDRCSLGPRRKHNKSAKAWCAALEKRFPDIAALGNPLLTNPPGDFHRYLYPKDSLQKEEWERRAVAGWYAILQHGIEHGDTLEYW